MKNSGLATVQNALHLSWKMPFSPSHLLCVAGIMTRALAAVDDTVTETIW